jgi:hypothetical protein
MSQFIIKSLSIKYTFFCGQLSYGIFYIRKSRQGFDIGRKTCICEPSSRRGRNGIFVKIVLTGNSLAGKYPVHYRTETQIQKYFLPILCA